MKRFYLPSDIDVFNGELLLSELEQAQEGDEVAIIWCYGGDVDTALKIAKKIEEKKLNTYADLLVASAGVLVFSAGENRIAEPHTKFMFHRTLYSGYYKEQINGIELEADAEALKNFDEALASYIANKCNISADKILELMDTNAGLGSWLNCEQAIELGLVNDLKEVNAIAEQKMRLVAKIGKEFAMEEQQLKNSADVQNEPPTTNEVMVIQQEEEEQKQEEQLQQQQQVDLSSAIIEAVKAELTSAKKEIAEMIKELTTVSRRGKLIKPEELDKQNKTGDLLSEWVSQKLKF